MGNNKITDIELFEKYKLGKIEITAQLFDKYFNDIYIYIFVRVQSKEVAENITEETFSQLLSFLEKIDTDIEKFIEKNLFNISDILIERYFENIDSSTIINNKEFRKILKNKLEITTYTKFRNTKNKKINIAKKGFFSFYKDGKNIFEKPEFNFKKLIIFIIIVIILMILGLFLYFYFN